MSKNNISEDDFLDEFDENLPISDQLVSQFEDGEFDEDFSDPYEENNFRSSF